ncbi:MAG: protein-disulfide isomerase [Alphaproteobacteria bacterium]|jgi:protein-disulfide isomerase
MTPMKNILALSFVFALSAFVPAVAVDGHDHLVQEPAEVIELLKLKETDMYEGEKDAPIQVVEYASMTCGHCADFHTKHYHEIKEKLIDTGKVRFVFRELPWDNRALAASMVARCAPTGEYFNFISALMSTRDTWATSDDFLGSIKKIARLGGMAPADVDTCMKNETVNDIVRKSYAEATGPMQVKGTPTFFVNGQRVPGVMTTDILVEMIAGIEENAAK